MRGIAEALSVAGLCRGRREGGGEGRSASIGRSVVPR
jgi:hypothetical protein